MLNQPDIYICSYIKILIRPVPTYLKQDYKPVIEVYLMGFAIRQDGKCSSFNRKPTPKQKPDL